MDNDIIILDLDNVSVYYSVSGCISPTEEHQYWIVNSNSSDEKSTVPGYIVKFHLNTKEKSEEDNERLIENRKIGSCNCEDSKEYFDSSKDYMVHRMFVDMMATYCGTHYLVSNDEPNSMMFFCQDDDDFPIEDICKLLSNLTSFANTVENNLWTIRDFLALNELQYENLLSEMNKTWKQIYNDTVLPYAKYKIGFYNWNLMDFIIPKEEGICWIPNDTDDIEKIKEAYEKTFGDFASDKYIKKVYFDLYDLNFDEYVDYHWHGACGKGWYPLIVKIFKKFREVEEKSAFWWERIIVEQIKEKFSGLRFYFSVPVDWYFEYLDGKLVEHSIDDELEDFVHSVENESYEICEYCGKTKAEDPTVKSAGPGWIKTLCDSCRKTKDEKEIY